MAEVIIVYDPDKAGEAQDRYCEEHHVPRFAPSKYADYRCGGCYKNIYRDGGISVEEAGRRLVTGCPFCHRSFCE